MAASRENGGGKSRAKILKAAVAVFSRRGFHQAQVEEIAKKAGVGKGTIYLYFPDKASLFAAAVSEGLESVILKIREDLKSDLPFSEHFPKLIESCVSLYLENGDLSKILINELSSGIAPEAMREIEAMRERFVDFLAEILEEGARLGYIRQTDYRLAAAGVMGLMDALCNRHLKNRRSPTKEQIVETMSGLMMEGLTVFKNPAAQQS